MCSYDRRNRRSLEADAAKWYKASGSKKPIVGFIAGETVPQEELWGMPGQ